MEKDNKKDEQENKEKDEIKKYIEGVVNSHLSFENSGGDNCAVRLPKLLKKYVKQICLVWNKKYFCHFGR